MEFRRVLFRSEEHTSELQSHDNLVCRLLLEKKQRLTSPRAPRRCRAPASGPPGRAPPRASRRRANTERISVCTGSESLLLFFFFFLINPGPPEMCVLSRRDALPI